MKNDQDQFSILNILGKNKNVTQRKLAEKALKKFITLKK